MGRPDSTDLLPRIAEPTTIIVGERDTVTPVSDSERLQSEIRQATLTVIPGAGHLSNVEQPSAFNAAVGRFLAERF
jgi:3-oxoadipate enol-lactonase